MEVVSYKGQVVENDSNLLSLVPEVDSLICYDWGGLDRPLLHFFVRTVSAAVFGWNDNAAHTRELL